MSLCFSNCLNTPPSHIAPESMCCRRDVRRLGGIQRLVFISCDYDTSNIMEWTTVDWCNLYKRGIITITPRLIASKPESSYDKRKLSSCGAETTVGITHKIEFEDYNIDSIEGTDTAFWNSLQQNPTKYPFGYITCDGYFTGFMNPVGIELSNIISSDSNEPIYWKGVIEWEKLDNLVPIYINNHLEAILNSCVGVPNFDKCKVDPLDSLRYLNDIDSGCSKGDVTIIAPFYANATYTWYLDGEVVQTGSNNYYSPDKFGLPVEVLINVNCCEYDTTCFIRTKVRTTVRRNVGIYDTFALTMFSNCTFMNPYVPYPPNTPLPGSNQLYPSIIANPMGPNIYTFAQAIIDSFNSLGNGFKGYISPGDPPNLVTLESPCTGPCPCSDDTFYYWYYSSIIAGEAIIYPGRCIRFGGGLIGPIIPKDSNNGNVPTVSSVNILSDGTGYFKVTAVPTASVPNMSYRLINSQGYQTGWQSSSIFRGVIPGETTVQIRVAGFECVTSYNFSI